MAGCIRVARASYTLQYTVVHDRCCGWAFGHWGGGGDTACCFLLPFVVISDTEMLFIERRTLDFNHFAVCFYLMLYDVTKKAIEERKG